LIVAKLPEGLLTRFEKPKLTAEFKRGVAGGRISSVRINEITNGILGVCILLQAHMTQLSQGKPEISNLSNSRKSIQDFREGLLNLS